jgi:hypothetical protein
LRTQRSAALLALLAFAAAAEEGIRLKTRTLDPGGVAAGLEAPRRRTPGRSHWLLEFRGVPGPERLAAMRARGIRVTSGISRNAVAVSAPDGVDFAALGATGAARLAAEDKVSPLLAAWEAAVAVVEFHAGVASGPARDLVDAAGLEVLEHPDLLPHHLLVAGPPGRLASLAEWDEVAYLFPAAPELASGARVASCGGAAFETGVVAQYVQVGTGWGEGPLHYFFAGLTQKLDRSTVESEILRALWEWTRFAPLEFFPANSPTAARTIAILFARGAHGCGYPFDGPGRVLAHTFYPSPPNPEPLAGDMHLDEDESWRVGAAVDLFTVALHEAGHALGLGHSDRPGSVMYPYYRQASGLADDDIAGIRALYGSRGAAAPPQAPGEPAAPPPPPGPLGLAILEPPSAAVTTYAASLALSGRTENGTGQVRVSWRSDRGPAGDASGAANWSAGVPLETGVNTITVTASDEAGAAVSRTVRATREAPAGPAVPGGPTVPASSRRPGRAAGPEDHVPHADHRLDVAPHDRAARDGVHGCACGELVERRRGLGGGRRDRLLGGGRPAYPRDKQNHGARPRRGRPVVAQRDGRQEVAYRGG